MREKPRWVADIVTVVGIVALFGIVYLLPPDTSLAQVTEARLLRVCVPTLYPPLVTGKPDAPGIDVELVRAIADAMGVKLSINANSAMGRDFNPRNWNVTRAQCQVLAGGVVVSDLTRSFLDTTPAHQETGWAMAAKTIPDRLQDVKLGFYAGLVGLDRIALSRFLQSQKAKIEIVASPEALTEGLRSGRFDGVVSEALLVRQIAGAQGLQAAWFPETLVRYPVALGLWKGDLTLKRRLVAAIDEIERSGKMSEITKRYAIAPIATTLRAN